jgi:hypothetical protein
MDCGPPQKEAATGAFAASPRVSVVKRPANAAFARSFPPLFKNRDKREKRAIFANAWQIGSTAKNC